jgi:hypothetical protein
MDYELVDLKLEQSAYSTLQDIANSAGVSVEEVIKVILALHILNIGDTE